MGQVWNKEWAKQKEKLRQDSEQDSKPPPAPSATPPIPRGRGVLIREAEDECERPVSSTSSSSLDEDIFGSRLDISEEACCGEILDQVKELLERGDPCVPLLSEPLDNPAQFNRPSRVEVAIQKLMKGDPEHRQVAQARGPTVSAHQVGPTPPPPSPGGSSGAGPTGDQVPTLSDQSCPSASSTEGEDDVEPLSAVEACVENDTETVKEMIMGDMCGVNDVTEEGDTLLLIACTSGFYPMVEMLLQLGADPEERGSKNDCTPLMEAAGSSFVDIVGLLLSHKADVNAQSGTGDTALHISARGGHEQVVVVLIKAGAALEEQNENGHTPLMEAASAGHVKVASVLISKGAGINTHSNEFKESALTLACYKGHYDMVKFLLEHGADLDHKTDEMHTALMEASMDGHTEVAKLLLDSGAQVNMPADSFESPLTLAACGGHTELAILLIGNHANLEEVNDEGYTPLMEAAREGHEDMVRLLHTKGADINAQTEETQETALTLACCGGFIDVADFLIKQGANIEQGCSTPLMEAAQEGHLDLVKHLLHCGANVHAVTSTQDTALTVTTENGHTDVAAVLIDASAQVNHASDGGRTPLMKAARGGHTCTLDFLIKVGADTNRMTTNLDHTALSLACAGGHVSCVERLLIQGADPTIKLKDNMTALMEAARGGFSPIVRMLLTYPKSIRAAAPPSNSMTDHVMVEDKDNIAGRLEQFISKVMSQSDLDGEQEAKKRSFINNLQRVEAQFGSHLSGGVAPSDHLKAFKPNQAIMSQLEKGHAAAGAVVPTVTSESNMAAIAAAAHGNPDTFSSLSMSAMAAELLPLQQHQQIQQQLQQVAAAAASSGQGRRPPLPLHIALQNHLQAHRVTEGNVTDLANALQDWDKRDLNSTMYSDFKPMPVFQQGLGEGVVPGEEGSMAGLSGPYEGQHAVTDEGYHTSANNLLATTLAAAIQSGAPLPASPEALAAQWAQEGEGSLPSQLIARGMFGDGTRAMFDTGDMPENKTAGQWDGVAPEKRFPTAVDPQLQQQHQQAVLGMHGSHQPQYQHLAAVTAAVAAGVPATASGAALLAQQHQFAQQHQTPPQFIGTAGQLANGVLRGQGMTADHPTLSDLAIPDMFRAQPSPGSSAPLSPDAQPPHQGGLDMPPLPPVGHETGAGVALVVDPNTQTENNNDTALTFSASGGHNETTQLLMMSGAKTEHRDKKGFTPLILAATGGHLSTVETLLDNGAQLEAVSDRTKDSALSLACSGGRFEIVDLLLKKGANKEHRNVSDYTPLSLAASGGYQNIITLLLSNGADINSRTGSKLGISPLMLAAMNGHTAAVKLLLDNGADINAQIETNRNTALTLACFQGRHEVVALLVERHANIEHRAKTGLTPLMEAASGGYVEVGRVLLGKLADVNAAPVPSSRDTALTIAADKGHYRFVELLIKAEANVNAKNKKGNSPLWLACSGGHLDVVQLLVNANSIVDSQDNRKVSCLMASFRKGHVKVVRWLVRHVTQFPSDAECQRFNNTLSDPDLLQKCRQCMDIIVTAKDRQAAEATKHANILLKEIDQEKEKEERNRETAAKKRERKKQKKKEKAQAVGGPSAGGDGEKGKSAESSKSSSPGPQTGEEEKGVAEAMETSSTPPPGPAMTGSVRSTSEEPTAPAGNKSVAKEPPLAEVTNIKPSAGPGDAQQKSSADVSSAKGRQRATATTTSEAAPVAPSTGGASAASNGRGGKRNRGKRQHEPTSSNGSAIKKAGEKGPEGSVDRQEGTASRQEGRGRETAGPSGNGNRVIDLDDFETVQGSSRSKASKAGKVNHVEGSNVRASDPFASPGKSSRSAGGNLSMAPSPGKKGKRGEEGWKEVSRKNKKITIPHQVAPKVLKQLPPLREHSKANIDVDKATKSGDRNVTIRGQGESTRVAHAILAALIAEPEKTLDDFIPHHGGSRGGGGKSRAANSHHHGHHNSQQQGGGGSAGVPALTSINTTAPAHTLGGAGASGLAAGEDTLSSIGTFRIADFMVGSSGAAGVPAKSTQRGGAQQASASQSASGAPSVAALVATGGSSAKPAWGQPAPWQKGLASNVVCGVQGQTAPSAPLPGAARSSASTASTATVQPVAPMAPAQTSVTASSSLAASKPGSPRVQPPTAAVAPPVGAGAVKRPAHQASLHQAGAQQARVQPSTSGMAQAVPQPAPGISFAPSSSVGPPTSSVSRQLTFNNNNTSVASPAMPPAASRDMAGPVGPTANHPNAALPSVASLAGQFQQAVKYHHSTTTAFLLGMAPEPGARPSSVPAAAGEESPGGVEHVSEGLLSSAQGGGPAAKPDPGPIGAPPPSVGAALPREVAQVPFLYSQVAPGPFSSGMDTHLGARTHPYGAPGSGRTGTMPAGFGVPSGFPSGGPVSEPLAMMNSTASGTQARFPDPSKAPGFNRSMSKAVSGDGGPRDSLPPAVPGGYGMSAQSQGQPQPDFIVGGMGGPYQSGGSGPGGGMPSALDPLLASGGMGGDGINPQVAQMHQEALERSRASMFRRLLPSPDDARDLNPEFYGRENMGVVRPMNHANHTGGVGSAAALGSSGVGGQQRYASPNQPMTFGKLKTLNPNAENFQFPGESGGGLGRGGMGREENHLASSLIDPSASFPQSYPAQRLLGTDHQESGGGLKGANPFGSVGSSRPGGGGPYPGPGGGRTPTATPPTMDGGANLRPMSAELSPPASASASSSPRGVPGMSAAAEERLHGGGGGGPVKPIGGERGGGWTPVGPQQGGGGAPSLDHIWNTSYGSSSNSFEWAHGGGAVRLQDSTGHRLYGSADPLQSMDPPNAGGPLHQSSGTLHHQPMGGGGRVQRPDGGASGDTLANSMWARPPGPSAAGDKPDSMPPYWNRWSTQEK